MLTVKKILVPTDFSVHAGYAISYALQMAKKLQATEIHLINIDLYSGKDNDAALLERLQQKAAKYQTEVPLVLKSVHADYIAPGITQYAQENEVDVIIMGTHGLRGMRRFLLGSVAEEVVRMAPCPVITLHDLPEGEHETLSISRILVPVDFSGYSRESLSQAKYLAEAYGATLDVLYVIEEWDYPPMLGFHPPSLAQTNPEMKPQAEAAIIKFVQETPGPEVPYTTDVVFGNIVPTIQRTAQDVYADLIVIATHGVSNEWQELMGSVTEKLVRTTTTPIWTIRPFGKGVGEKPASREEWVAQMTVSHVA